MPDLLNELCEQPQALRELSHFYAAHPREIPPRFSHGPQWVIFTGMGASYHAALIAATHAGALGLQALAIEAVDLLNYHATGLLQHGHTLVYISQSGKSVEVGGVLEQNHGRADVIAVTNAPDSPLARQSKAVLPIFATQIFRLASKNYVNTLAALWLLVRRWAGSSTRADVDYLNGISVRMERLIQGAGDCSASMLADFAMAEPLVFLGHGPHAATARQSALMLSEWARTPSQYISVGAFRHGFVETVTPRMAALFFTPPGRTCASALTLARALPEFGVTVRRIAFGELCGLEEPSTPPEASQPPMDEFLSPMLDVIPMQFFTAVLSKVKGVTPDFKFIDKTRIL